MCDFVIIGNYSRLACEIQFVRSMGYYLIQIYIPSSLIVVISWVSFWLNRGATPARVGLGVTTVLTMTTLMASTNAALPKISYVKSIDVYLGFCFFMVFAALLEYASVGYVTKRILVRKLRFEKLQKIGTTILTQWKNKRTTSNNAVLSNKVSDQHATRKLIQDIDTIYGMRGSDIDKYSRVIFPVTFFCFQLTYWIIYLHMSRDTLDELVYLQQY